MRAISTSTFDRRLGALFLLSGASGLVFEVLWVKALGLWVGHTTLSMCLVVSAFLTGLLAGNLAVTPFVDRSARPLRLYAWVEALTGLAALLVSRILPALSGGTLLATLTSTPVRVLIAFGLVLLPTMAMGASLPALTRAATDRIERAPRVFGALYALNTLGAVLGCALAGFWSIGAIGLTRTSLLAASVNLVVAALAAAIDRTTPDRTAPAEPTPAEHTQPSETSLPVAPALLLASMATGFASIACEVLWFRVLRSFVKSSTYAFTLLLVVFLSGLALGGALVGRLRTRPQREVLGDLQSLQGFLLLLSTALLGRSGTLAAALARLLHHGVHEDGDFAQAALGTVILLGPTMVMGASFPLMNGLAAGSMGSLGRSVAWVSAANTLGGAAASMVTALAIIPTLGAQRGMALSSGLSALVGVWVSAPGEARRRALRAGVALALAWVLLPSEYLVRAMSTYGLGEVLEVREGRDGTATVIAYDRDRVCARSPNHCRGRCAEDFHYRQLLFGTVSYASTIPPARRYMRALAHLPMLLHPGPVDALQICFGTGTTAGSFTTHPTLRSLTIADLNPDVFSFARYFRESNLGALDDPRVHTVIEDGRRFLSSTQQDFDVISLEPPPPTAEGAVSLYTREFYALARRRMRPGAVLAQWIPLDQQSDGLDRSMLAAMRAEFPEVWVYLPSRVEGVVLASAAALTPDLAQWSRATETLRVHENLMDVGFSSASSLLSTLVLDTRGTDAYIAHAPPMTDDLPRVEYYRSFGGGGFDLTSMLSHAFDPTTFGASPTETAAERLQMRAHMRSVGGDARGASELAMQAQALRGATSYTRYLTTLEYDCLNLDAP